MGAAYRLAVPSAVIGSLLLALFGFLITADLTVPVSAAAPFTSSGIVGEVKDKPQKAQSGENATGDQSVGKAQPGADQQPGDKSKRCKVSARFPQSIRKWCDLITQHARMNNLEPDLLAALIWQESGGNPTAYSKSGAVGLMQVMPKDGIAASFQCKNGPCFKNRPSISELQDPEFNIQYGARMLSGLLARYGNIRDALLYYGPIDVGYYYADKVLGIYKNYGN